MTSGYEVRVVADKAGLDACFAVRRDVFVTEQGVPPELEYDAYDALGAATVHVLAAGADGPLGTGRLLLPAAGPGRGVDEPGVGSLGRLAVAAAARGRGVGVALVRAIEDAARERGLTAVDLHAQTHALGFYERLGYVAYGPEFPDAGIPHRAMRRTVGDSAAHRTGADSK
ncbi:GNAT family N-acetyltransferase [Streptomyces sp. NPDC090052]|uniref:GNAT family N-acetyltransferase n=1 Tax=unclassified Streptomyces TaxID=2593676 RepID=UPI00225213BF|nr:MULTISPECIES: GNAT family N-acetyltransferase [unclassified Streptomyces]MCX4727142.1 GNAT family N-acetyltransferase [Streptomyces sp. NBC_01306]WSV03601.1 GNAT family N-acetyltransferase [Streptomyces sp. NBC_01020]WSX70395.1 GNAT family N-acetyltransferase [Streptomyces sp. NBC_00932]